MKKIFLIIAWIISSVLIWFAILAYPQISLLIAFPEIYLLNTFYTVLALGIIYIIFKVITVASQNCSKPNMFRIIINAIRRMVHCTSLFRVAVTSGGKCARSPALFIDLLAICIITAVTRRKTTAMMKFEIF
jgi:hypothetical protein